LIKFPAEKRDGDDIMKKMYLAFLEFSFDEGVDQVVIFFEIWLPGGSSVLVINSFWPRLSAAALFIACLSLYFLYFLFKYFLEKKVRMESTSLMILMARFWSLVILAGRLNVSARDLYRMTTKIDQMVGLRIQISLAQMTSGWGRQYAFVISALNKLFNEKKNNHSFLFRERWQYSLMSHYLRRNILSERFAYEVERGFDNFLVALGEALYSQVNIARKEAAKRMKMTLAQVKAPDQEYKDQIEHLLTNPFLEANQIAAAIKQAAINKNNYRLAKGGLYASIYCGTE